MCSDFINFKAGSHYVAAAGLELATYARLALNVSLPECSNTPSPRHDLSFAVSKVQHQKEASKAAAGPPLSHRSLAFHRLWRGKAQYASLV